VSKNKILGKVRKFDQFSEKKSYIFQQVVVPLQVKLFHFLVNILMGLSIDPTAPFKMC